jgi:rubrerythrin
MSEMNIDDITFKSGKDGSFEFDRNLTVVEILGIAIKAEVSAYSLYKRLALRVQNPVVKQRILGLAEDEQNHRLVLSEKYVEMTGEEMPAIPKTGDLRQMDIDVENKSNKEIIQIAAAKEAQAAKFYVAAMDQVKDPGGKAMLEYLADMERGHETVLRQELKQLDKNPLWHEQQGGQFFHIGP